METPQPTPAVKAEQPTKAEPQVVEMPHKSYRRSSIGMSLTDLLSHEEPSEATAEVATSAAPTIDPDSERKLTEARSVILSLVRTERPRFYPAFERMEIRGNEIHISVPSRELHDEILRNKTALLMQIVEEASIEGMVELCVAVNEEIRAERPIKLEDRLKHLNEKCEKLAELRKALDMEVE